MGNGLSGLTAFGILERALHAKPMKFEISPGVYVLLGNTAVVVSKAEIDDDAAWGKFLSICVNAAPDVMSPRHVNCRCQAPVLKSPNGIG